MTETLVPGLDLAPEPPIRLPSSRRRIVLSVMMAALAAFLLFAAWYLITRKPISEIIPPFASEKVPHYAFSLNGVTAPLGVAVSPDGSRIYVTQTEGDAAVLLFDGSGTLVRTITPPAETGADHVPVYLALDPKSGDLYVSDRLAGALYVYSADGEFLRVFDPGTALAGWQPLGLAFDRDGNLWVTDLGGEVDSVHEFGPDGALLRTIDGGGQFEFPNGIALDAKGNVYVTDSNHGRLVIFDANGTQAGVVRRGGQTSDLGLPRGIAIDGEGRVYVVDTTAQGVQLYRASADAGTPPRFIARFGEEGVIDGGFQYPNGVAVDARSRVYVTDSRNDRVQVWTY